MEKKGTGMLWKVLLAVFGVFTLGLFAVAYVIFKNSYKRRKNKELEVTLPDEGWAKEHHENYIQGCIWTRDIPGEEWSLTSKDGLRLMAKYVPAKGEAVRNLVLVHGWHSVYFKDMSGIAQWHAEHGANILLIYQRNTLTSEGDYLTMGVRESEDVALWAEMMDARTLRKLPMYLHGVSMGGATVLMAQGEELPANVKGIIADCGFTSPWEISLAVSRQWYPWLPAKLVGYVVDIYTRHLAGFGLKEKNTVDILRKAKIPTLFVHGMLDDFVPPHMSVKNYQACAAPKRIILSEEATHALSWYYDNEKYAKALEDFFAWTLEENPSA